MTQPDPADSPVEQAPPGPDAAPVEQAPPGPDAGFQAGLSWLDRRRNRIVAEIQRNRRGEYRVPTWVLGAILVLIVAGWAALIVVS